MTITFVGSNVLDKCPAQVNMTNGQIEINRDVWDKFKKWEKVFIIEHEKGHFLLQTDCEKRADAYALKETYKITHNALKHALNTLIKMNVKDKTRINSLYNEIINIKKNKDMRPKSENNSNSIKKNPITGKFKAKNKKNRADGEEPANIPTKQPITTTNATRSHKKNGFVLGNFYISNTNILLFVIAIIGIVTAVRVGKS